MALSAIKSESQLCGLAVRLGAADAPENLSVAEQQLISNSITPPTSLDISRVISLVQSGADPLGNVFLRLRTATVRREVGATYTPRPLVETMVKWARQQGDFDRIVDAGAGSGRFTLAAAKVFPQSTLYAVDTDPLSSLCLRAALASCGLTDRSFVSTSDFCEFTPEQHRALTRCGTSGIDRTPRTLWIGNPPYVRHHNLSKASKNWLKSSAQKLGYNASALAGLHVYFFLATALKANAGDVGCYITSSEWLDVNYGSLVRNLLTNELGLESLDILSPKVEAFEGVASTATITCFKPGTTNETVTAQHHQKVETLGTLGVGSPKKLDDLQQTTRWTTLLHPRKARPCGYIELGEICRVHRGAVTGANKVFVVGDDHPHIPDAYLKPSVTKAKELFRSGGVLDSSSHLRYLVKLPTDLDQIPPSDRNAIEIFLDWARSLGAHQGYVARKRKAWWSVKVRDPAPILATYMARRPPTFVRNITKAAHINIAHGLYPLEPLSPKQLDRLAQSLRECVDPTQGRTYAGGLTKFEPREMQRIAIPDPTL